MSSAPGSVDLADGAAPRPRTGRARLRRLRGLVERKSLVFLLCAAPAAMLLVRGYTGRLGADPIEEVLHATGEWTMRLLIATLAITPLVRLSGWNWPRRARRMVGLFAFGYAFAHLTIYAWVDQGLLWSEILEDVTKRRFITVGFAAFLLLIPLAATSFDAAIRRIGPDRWRKLHRLAYAAAILGVVHFLWLVKADLVEPILYGSVLTLLLTTRAVLAWRRPRRSP